MFRHATATSFAMLTPKGPSDHAGYTEVLVIEFPQAQKFINDCLLLGTTSKPRDITRIFDHAVCIEVCAKSIADGEK